MIDLSKVKNRLKKDYGSLKTGGELKDTFDYVSTGNLALNLISDGGIPFGYVAEFLGKSQSGKSLIIQQIIANAQKDYDAVGVLIDRENAYSKKRGEELKINNDNLFVLPPQDSILVPDAFEFLMDTIVTIRKADGDDGDNKTHIVLAIDSIAAFDQDTELKKSSTPRRAKDIHAGFRKLLPYLDDRIMLLVANQVTYKVGVLFGNPETSTSGESLKYYSHVRFALEDRKKIIDELKDKEVIGNWIGIESIKTRFGPCYRTCYLKHFYKTGIDYYSGYGRLLVNRGYLEPKNKTEFNKFKQSTLVFGNENVNENNMNVFLENHPELLFMEYPEYHEHT